MTELIYFRAVIARLQQRLIESRRNEAGYSTETVVVTALLVVMALAALAIISTKVIGKANGLQTG